MMPIDALRVGKRQSGAGISGYEAKTDRDRKGLEINLILSIFIKSTQQTIRLNSASHAILVIKETKQLHSITKETEL
jgi:hypothetical protein